MLLLFTDGVTEAVDAGLEEFGERRLEQFTMENQTSSAEEIAAGLEMVLDKFTGSTQPFDDITIVAVKRRSVS
jgi:serine phosphatase RsbU (regulator of sigma subunit)